MDIEVLKRAIVEYQEFIAKVDFVRRDFTFEGDVRYVLVGIRQAEKSYLSHFATVASNGKFSCS